MAVKKRPASPKAPTTEAPLAGWLLQMPRLLAFLFIATFFIIRMNFREIPIERDEGSYVYMGHLLAKGATPYVDFYEMKPPAIFYSYAFLDLISGGDITAMHVTMAFLLSIGGMLLFYLVRRWMDDASAAFATLAYCALSLTAHSSGFSLQSEHFVALFAIAGLWSLTRGLQDRSPWAIVLAGSLLTYGLLVKQNGLFFALLAVTMVPLFHRTENKASWLRATLVDGGWLALGALFMAAVFGSTLAVQGNFSDFWFWNIEYSKSYTSSIPWDLGKQLLTNGVERMFDEQPVFWSLAVGGVFAMWMTRAALWKKWSITGFLLAAMASVTPGIRFYGHYFLHFFPALAVASGAFLYALLQWIEPLTRQRTRTVLGLVISFAIFLFTLIDQESYYFRPNHERIMRTTYGSNPFPETKRLSEYLNTVKRVEDEVIVFGSEPQVYAYTKLVSPTLHHFMGFLLKNHPKEMEWQREVIQALEKDPPRFAVWVQHPLSWTPAANADQTIISWGMDWVQRKYLPIAWYDQTEDGSYRAVEGEAALQYQPQGKQYLILLERMPEPPASLQERE